MKRFCTFAAASLCAAQLLAQHPSCGGGRYADPIFADIDTALAVKFGENTTIGGTFQELFMDVYYPATDAAATRPAIVFAFGGSFIGGAREDVSSVCQYYAERGYVAAAIDYRLYDVFAIPDSTDMITEVVMAVSDFKAAIRFLRKDAATTNQFAIDPDYIFAGGISAGAIAADHTAYLDSMDTDVQQMVLDAVAANGGWEGNSNTDTMYSSSVQGVVNFSGALSRSVWLSAGEAPLFSAHDDQDGTVPYGADFARINLGFMVLDVIYMHGSSLMHSRADVVGVTNELITIPNSTGHVSYLGDPVWEDTVLTSSARFLQTILCGLNSSVTTPEWNSSNDVNAFPNPAKGDVMIRLSNAMNIQYDVMLMDAMGRLVFQSNNETTENFVLPRRDMAAGIYYLQIRPQGGAAPVTKKIVFN